MYLNQIMTRKLTVKPSLITAIADTNVSLDLVAFFNFVPLYDCFKDIHIISLNHSGMSRHYQSAPSEESTATSESTVIDTDNDKTFFKNSVTVPIRHKQTNKEWVVKINNSGFHICGAKEQEEALVICDQILQLMIATNNCLMNNENTNHKVHLEFTKMPILMDEFANHFDERMEEILSNYKDDVEKQEIVSYVNEAKQSGIFVPSSTTQIFIEKCNLVMINYVYKSKVNTTTTGTNETDETEETDDSNDTEPIVFSRLQFSKHILTNLQKFRSFKDGKYAIKIKFDYLCNAVHHGGSISMKLRNKETDKSQTIIVHVIKGSVVHSISSLDDLENGLEFLHEFFPMITDRLVL